MRFLFIILTVLLGLAGCQVKGGKSAPVSSGPGGGATPPASAPVITAVTPSASKEYVAGDILSFTVTFSEAVIVTGTPGITVNMGSGSVTAGYISGSGTTDLVFRYVVTVSDLDPDGIILSSPIGLNGGSISDLAAVDAAALTFSVPVTSGLTVDGIDASVSSVVPPADKTYIALETFDCTVNFTASVTVTGSPRLQLTVGSSTRYADYVSGSGSNSLLFRYTIPAGDLDSDGVAISSNINLNSGSILDAGGESATLTFSGQTYAGKLVEAILPVLSGVSAPADKTYILNETLDFVATFSEPVNVTGTPKISLTIGSSSRTADYFSGSGTSSLTFRYTVQNGDLDTNGISSATAITVTGASVRDLAGNAPSSLAFTAPGLTLVNVDGVIPLITTVSPPVNGNYDRTTSASVSFTVTFDQAVAVTGTPRLSLSVGSDARFADYVSGSGTASLVFTYTVSGTDLAMDGISVSSPVGLNSGTVKSSTGNSAGLTFTPPDLSGVRIVYPGMIVWYDPQDETTLFTNSACTTAVTADGDAVACMKDKSGKNHHSLQGVAGLAPLYRTAGIKNFPSLRFDGTNDMMSAASTAEFNNLPGLTAVAVFYAMTVDGQPRAIYSKRTSQTDNAFSAFLYTSNKMAIDVGPTGNRRTSTLTVLVNTAYLFTQHFDGSLGQASRSKMYFDSNIDSTQQSTVATAPTSPGEFHLGALNTNYGTYFNGYIGEVIFFKRSLDTSNGNELKKIEAYLQSKWGL